MWCVRASAQPATADVIVTPSGGRDRDCAADLGSSAGSASVTGAGCQRFALSRSTSRARSWYGDNPRSPISGVTQANRRVACSEIVAEPIELGQCVAGVVAVAIWLAVLVGEGRGSTSRRLGALRVRCYSLARPAVSARSFSEKIPANSDVCVTRPKGCEP